MPVLQYRKERPDEIWDGGERWVFTDHSTGANKRFGILPKERVLQLVAQRAVAKRAKDYREADSLRSTLIAHGMQVEDKQDGESFDVLY